MLLGAQVGGSAIPTKFVVDFNKQPKLLYRSSIPKPRLTFKSPLVCCCTKNNITDNPAQEFSVLSSEIPWETGSAWSIMAMYMLNLHIPLGIGGLSIVSYLLHQSVLDPQTQIVSLLFFQILELTGVLILLRTTAKQDLKPSSFFKSNEQPKERNWVLASVLGFGTLTLFVFLTSFLADSFSNAKDVNNPILKEILVNSNISKTASVLVYCFITPLMEEIVYRGFLLTSLSSTMNWQKAVLLSSIVFSAAHFSGDNFLQLFIIGCILGSCYCWTGNLTSSFAVHSLYNAMTLIITFIS